MAMAAGRCSHVLIMDDDIDVPDDLVTRVAAVLAWTHDCLCIGGAAGAQDQHQSDHQHQGHRIAPTPGPLVTALHRVVVHAAPRWIWAPP